MKTKKQLLEIAQKHVDEPENLMFLQSSGCGKEDAVNCVIVMMVEFYILMTNIKDENRP